MGGQRTLSLGHTTQPTINLYRNAEKKQQTRQGQHIVTFIKQNPLDLTGNQNVHSTGVVLMSELSWHITLSKSDNVSAPFVTKTIF